MRYCRMRVPGKVALVASAKASWLANSVGCARGPAGERASERASSSTRVDRKRQQELTNQRAAAGAPSVQCRRHMACPGASSNGRRPRRRRSDRCSCDSQRMRAGSSRSSKCTAMPALRRRSATSAARSLFARDSGTARVRTRGEQRMKRARERKEMPLCTHVPGSIARASRGARMRGLLPLTCTTADETNVKSKDSKTEIDGACADACGIIPRNE